MKIEPWVIAAGVLVLSLPVRAASQAPRTERDPFEIPASAKALTNPVTRSPESLRAGQVLWKAHCETCHGTTGHGDGPNARLHEMRKSVAPRDLTDPVLQQELADGELYWRITHGKIDGDNIIMPAFGTKVPKDLDRWQLVVFVRELGRAAAAAPAPGASPRAGNRR